MWNTALKFVAQLLIARFLRSRIRNANQANNESAQSHLGEVKHSLAALVESHAVLFKSQLHTDIQRVVKSLLGFILIFFAMLCSGLTALMWLFAMAWNSPNQEIILGTAIILPIIIAIGLFLVIQHTWKKQPLFAKSMVQIENDWQVFRNGLNGKNDISDQVQP